MTIKLIAIDIDGTLLDSNSKLPADNARAIGEAAGSGIQIVIVTGRRFHSARLIADELPCDVQVITSNGALIKTKSGDTTYRRLLPVTTARQVLDATEEFRPSTGIIFDRPDSKQVVFERIDWDGLILAPYLRRHRHQVAEIQPLASCLDGEDPVEVMFIGECASLRRILQRLDTLPIAGDYKLALTEYEHRNLSMLDVLQSGVSKGTALAEWARRRGIAREQVMAIGDNWNDHEMLEYAGLPVVMGNSVESLKSRGWRLTLSNDACGVAHAIHTYAL